MFGRCENSQAVSEAEFRIALFDVLWDIKLKRPLARMPTTRDLARRMRCGRSAVERAKSGLVQDGTLIIERHRGVELWAIQSPLFRDQVVS